jgi:hypothetical protein
MPTMPPLLLLVSVQAQPSCQQQALLARFHTAMSSIRGWRLMVRMQQPPAAAAAAADTASGAAAAAEERGIGQAQQQQQEQTCIEPPRAACAAAAAGHSHSARMSLSGYPLPLSLEALAGGSSGWCCGCVQVQQQEQSCWVRFNLPAALKQDSSIVEAADKGLLVSRNKQLLQLLAAGLLSRIVSIAVEMSLQVCFGSLQSSSATATPTACWGIVLLCGIRDAGAAKCECCLSVNHFIHWTKQCTRLTSLWVSAKSKSLPAVCRCICALQVGAVQALSPCGWFDVACASPFSIEDDDMAILLQSHKTGFYAWDQADEDGTDRQADMQQLPWDMQPDTWQQQQQQQKVPLQQQQDVPAAAGDQPDIAMDEAQAQQQQQEPKLRMLVYIHYEQLLQALPWQLPQQLPLPELPVLASLPDIARHLAASRGAALWVHVDVCQLHGGHRLGSCVAPLSITGVAAEKLVFGALEQSVLVALYDPGSDKNSSRALQDASQQQQQQQNRHAWQEEHCELLLLGRERMAGRSRGVCNTRSSSGLLLQSAADVLLELVGQDEVSRQVAASWKHSLSRGIDPGAPPATGNRVFQRQLCVNICRA